MNFLAASSLSDKRAGFVTYPTHELNKLDIVGDKIYEHKTIRLNYTTYDMHRFSDFLNPNSSPADVMLYSQESIESNDGEAPFLYARIIGIFHAIVRWDDQPTTKKIDFLWVRWFRRDETHPFGDVHLRLERITFASDEDSPQFGFLDPGMVLRAAHLVPAFSTGHVQMHLGPSRLARTSALESGNSDYASYYVCR